MKTCFFLACLLFTVTRSSPALAETKTITANSQATIAPVLELTLSEAGQSELRFGDIRPSALGPIEAGPVLIVIEIKSNTGERYQITQMVNGSLKNSAGDEIAPEQLKFQTTALKSAGKTVPTETAVSASAQIIFESDTLGSSDTIEARYTLTVPPSQAPGDYSALLTFTVSTV